MSTDRTILASDPVKSLSTEAVEEIQARIDSAEAKGYARAIEELREWIETSRPGLMEQDARSILFSVRLQVKGMEP